MEKELRIARLCWNTNGWEAPSGKEGKSRNKKLYENEFGFGHEEWLLDFSKKIKGLHYGFIQGVNQSLKSFIDKKMDIVLYSRKNDGKLILVGMLTDVECIDRNESTKISTIYKEKGWHEKMRKDVKKIAGDEDGLIPDTKCALKKLDNQFFNVKFKVEDFKKAKDLSPQWLKKIKSSRYLLLTPPQDIQNEIYKQFNVKL